MGNSRLKAKERDSSFLSSRIPCRAGESLRSKRCIATRAVASVDVRNIPSTDAPLLFYRKEIIRCRLGLQFAPSTHCTLSKFLRETVRFRFGYHNTEEGVDKAVEAL